MSNMTWMTLTGKPTDNYQQIAILQIFIYNFQLSAHCFVFTVVLVNFSCHSFHLENAAALSPLISTVQHTDKISNCLVNILGHLASKELDTIQQS